jgi:predicted Rossmann fold flavoprotein
VAWFEERGVPLKTESDGRCFPTSDSSETIINCLLDAASIAGVEIRKQQRVESIQKKEDRFLIQLQNYEINADCVLLATGSSSQGYLFAKEFGHPIIGPVPSLFTFNIPTSPLLDLSGISVPQVIASLKDTNFKQQGPLLLTHWGFSGPAVLKLSAWAARKLHDLDYKATLLINWISSLNQEEIYQTLLQKKEEIPLQTMPPFLPNNLLARLCKDVQIDLATPLGKLPNKALAKLAAKLHSDPYLIEGKTTYKQEFVTAGGVDLKGIDFRTMESKITSGLFFAGEILNIDGITGGFNFQNAWTTGWLAGTAMKNLRLQK